MNTCGHPHVSGSWYPNPNSTLGCACGWVASIMEGSPVLSQCPSGPGPSHTRELLHLGSGLCGREQSEATSLLGLAGEWACLQFEDGALHQSEDRAATRCSNGFTLPPVLIEEHDTTSLCFISPGVKTASLGGASGLQHSLPLKV